MVNNALGLIQRKKQTHRSRKNSKLNRTCTAYKRQNSAMRKDYVWTKKDVGMKSTEERMEEADNESKGEKQAAKREEIRKERDRGT